MTPWSVGANKTCTFCARAAVVIVTTADVEDADVDAVVVARAPTSSNATRDEVLSTRVEPRAAGTNTRTAPPRGTDTMSHDALLTSCSQLPPPELWYAVAVMYASAAAKMTTNGMRATADGGLHATPEAILRALTRSSCASHHAITVMINIAVSIRAIDAIATCIAHRQAPPAMSSPRRLWLFRFTSD